MTNHEPASGQPNVPAVSPETRTVVYVACLAVNIVSVVGFGLATIWGWLPSEQAAATNLLILGAINTVSNGLAVGYRPTRGGWNDPANR